MGDIFGKKSSPIKWNLKVKGRFSATKLEKSIKRLLTQTGNSEDALLKDSASGQRACRT
jgi:hypothetical protein